MNRPREIRYTDELLADASVHRRYDDGREEWRRRSDTAGARVVTWHDNRGGAGTDELLGDRIIKRTLSDGTVVYARDIGYGRTLWGRGETVLVNRSSFGGTVGAVLAGLGVAALAITAAQLPPASLTPEEEEELRQQYAQNQASGSGGSGGDGGGGGGGDVGGDPGDDAWESGWEDSDDTWSDDDFG
ncbi:hypothetical protein [Streptomyces antimicrobicus]|uniref:Uncharacterized protein n=1 Tax=Streptomyces antimicrobicus TaxID=2883108 RepID=A0ABS8BAV1_9ACTN|nr:hypothetical protein [Streptomyces antimicrobicus]MCB5181666.1 hypothetical protein [Streptomyces antimicrobicus]